MKLCRKSAAKITLFPPFYKGDVFQWTLVPLPADHSPPVFVERRRRSVTGLQQLDAKVQETKLTETPVRSEKAA